ncbi:MAG: ANTAR domain-containing protein [Gluconacetobacter diazotrophicus]|nr:ANTAR domain-containing protein [Gluconacetobacter diazotrophicus]
MKLLLADSDPARARWIGNELAGGPVREVVRADPGEALVDAFERHRPDVIVVDMARPDRDALDSVRHVAARLPGPVVMFVDQDDDAFMEEAIAAGVSSYNVVDRALPDVRPIVRTAVALFRRYRALQDELDRRLVVDRAKAALIRRRRISEPEAHRWLQREAMRRARRLADIAAEVLAAEVMTQRDGEPGASGSGGESGA